MTNRFHSEPEIPLATLVQRAREWAKAQPKEVRLAISGNTVRPRLVELRKQGRIVATDARRRTRSGRMATVYRAKGEQ